MRSGAKRHTIRGKRKRAWGEGDRLFLWIALRTKHRRFIGFTTVAMLEDCDIDLDTAPFRLQIALDGRVLADDEADRFAQADGFPSMREMYEFWVENHEFPFEGDVIHWFYPLQPRPVDKKKRRQKSAAAAKL